MSEPFLHFRRLVAALFGTLKLTQMYGLAHGTTQDALRNLAEAVGEAAEDDETRVSVRGSRVQVNGRTMRASECGALALSFLGEEWVKRGLEQVRFVAGISPADLGIFAAAFVEIDLNRPDPADRLRTACVSAGCEGIALEALQEQEHDPVLLEERRETAMRTYLRGLRAFRDVLRCDAVQDRPRIRRARRAVQGLVDNFLEDESAVLALAQIHEHDTKLFQHSLNVCIHALLIGQRMGMTRRQLGELGLAALFHDLGKTVADTDTGQARLEDLRQHPARGARLLLAEARGHEGMLKASIAAYEHHAHFDRSGYPHLDHDPHLCSRIVAVADCYEELTSQCSYRDAPYTAFDALSLMQAKAGTLFDPLLLKVFVNALGIYPVGSLVVLTTGEVALVIGGPTKPTQLDRPRVRIVRTEEGALEPGTILDLAEGDFGAGTGRAVDRTLSSEEVFGTVSEFVAAL